LKSHCRRDRAHALVCLVNTAPEGPLNATLAPDPPGRGRVGFSAVRCAGPSGHPAGCAPWLGLSTFVSAATAPPVRQRPCAVWADTDPAATYVVLLYLESIRQPAQVRPGLARLVWRGEAGGRQVKTPGSPRSCPPSVPEGNRSTRPTCKALLPSMPCDPGADPVPRFDTAAAAGLPAAAGRPPGLPLWATQRARVCGHRAPADEGLLPAGPTPVDVGHS